MLQKSKCTHVGFRASHAQLLNEAIVRKITAMLLEVHALNCTNFRDQKGIRKELE